MSEEENKELEQGSIEELVETLYSVHLDNSKMQYYAKNKIGRPVSMMPLTPFIYEFFLFNSLYHIDWERSLDKKLLLHHEESITETKKQREFWKYLKDYAKDNPSLFYRAFEPLIYLAEFKDEWTEITLGTRITKDQGQSFFRNIQVIQDHIHNSQTPSEIVTSKKIFKPIEDGIYYINQIRNNIFHGSKTLGQVHDKNQKLRIEVYELFLKCVTSLFFLSMGKGTVASDFIECPISGNSLRMPHEIEIFDIDTILRAKYAGLMKDGDSRLIAQFTEQMSPHIISPSIKSALFYPSAGKDMLTPLLLGLPYCRHFYFFERGQKKQSPTRINDFIKKIPKVQFPNTDIRQKKQEWKSENDIQSLDFVYDGIPRTIYWVHLDNLEFLKLDVELSFYFHRGDSRGEGGSDQNWDTKLLPKLKEKIPEGKKCVFLTDGQPGGIDKDEFEVCSELNMPFLERGRKYYYGYFV